MKFKILLFFLLYHFIGFSQEEIYFYKDIENTHTLESVKEKEFLLLEHQILEKHSNDSYWFLIPAHKTTSEYIFRIIFDRFNTDKDADVYQNSIKISKLSDQRYLSYRFTRDYDVYIKVKPKLHSFIPVDLETVQSNSLKEKNYFLLNGFYYGFAILIIIYNLFYFFFLKMMHFCITLCFCHRCVLVFL